MGRLFIVFILVNVALTVVALISCLSADEERLRALPRLGWVAVILLVPPAGAIAYLVAGRPRAVPGRPGGPRRPARPVAPDDDPDFLRQLDARRADEEADRRRREQEQRSPGEEPRRPEDEPLG